MHLVLLLALISCSKPKNDTENTNVSGSISYTVNGTTITMNNVDISTGEGVVIAKQLKGDLISSTRYLLNAQKGLNNFLGVVIISDSLKVAGYHCDSTQLDNLNFMAVDNLNYNGQISSLYYNGDYLDVQITSYKNNRVSGTFSGKFTPQKNVFDYAFHGTVVITDGKLNNVPVIY